MLQQKRLRVAADAGQVSALADELLGFRVRLSSRTGHDSYGAKTEEVHDDLVMALALACWQADRCKPPDAALPVHGLSDWSEADDGLDDALWVCGPTSGRPFLPDERATRRFVGGGADRATPPRVIAPPLRPRPYSVR